MAFILQFAEKVRQKKFDIVYSDEKELSVLPDQKTVIVSNNGNLAELMTKTFVDREDDDEDSDWGDE